MMTILKTVRLTSLLLHGLFQLIRHHIVGEGGESRIMGFFLRGSEGVRKTHDDVI